MPTATGQPFIFWPGWAAKLSVLVAAALYFVGIYLDSRDGVDVTQAAILQLLIPFVFAIPAVIIAQIAYWIARRRQRVGDFVFSVVIVAMCVGLAAASHFQQ